MNKLLREGVAAAGYTRSVESLPTEIEALQALVKRGREGDVVACMTHVERGEIREWLRSAGFEPVTADRLRERLGAGVPRGKGA
jgi:hypothetical protein